MFQSDVSVILATSYYFIKNTFFTFGLKWLFNAIKRGLCIIIDSFSCTILVKIADIVPVETS